MLNIPTVHLDLVLQSTPPPKIDTLSPNKELPKNWLTELVNLVQKQRPELSAKIFDKHIDESSTYTHKETLCQLLQVVYFRLNGDLDNALGILSNSAVAALVTQLMEDVDQCGPGFHNRVQLIVTSFSKPENLNQLLFMVRTNLVHAVATKVSELKRVPVSSKIHAFNQVTRIAVTQGYAVSANFEDDIYDGGINTETDIEELISTPLKNKFEQEYTAFKIPLLLCDELRGILADVGYSGENPEGYKVGEYGNFQKIIEKFLEKKIGITLFRLSTEDKIIDIDWIYIEKLFFDVLKENKYIKEDARPITLIEAAIAASWPDEKINEDIQISEQEIERQEEDDDEFDFNRDPNSVNEEDIEKYAAQQRMLREGRKPLMNAESSISPKVEKQTTTIQEHTQIGKEEIGNQEENNEEIANNNNEKKLELVVEIFKTMIEQKKFTDIVNQLYQLKSLRPHIYLSLSKTVQFQNALPILIKGIINQKKDGEMLQLMEILPPLSVIENAQNAIKEFCVAMINSKDSKEDFKKIFFIIDVANKYFNDDKSIKKEIINSLKKNFIKLIKIGQQSNIKTVLTFMIKNADKKDRQKIVAQTTQNRWNALVLAARHRPEALKDILEFMKGQCDKKTYQKIVAQTTEDGGNALMVAARHRPAALNDILGFMKTDFDKKTCKQIVEQTTKNGWNALMLAACYQPEALKGILNFLKVNSEFLDEESYKKVFQQQNENGKNALLLAACYQPGALKEILNFMQEKFMKNKNDSITTQKIVAQITDDIFDALILAARYQPDALKDILNFIKEKYDKETCQKIIEKTTEDGSNAFMLAARYQPEALEDILNFIKEKCDKETCQKIIEKTTKDGSNAFMLAARYQPEALKSILDFMGKNFDTKTCKEIIEKTTEDGSNAFMLAARYQPEALEGILNFLKVNSEFLGEESYKKFFQQQDENGKNALRLAAHYQPEALKSILGFMKENFGTKICKEIVEQMTHDGWNVLIVAARYQSEALKSILDFMGKNFDTKTCKEIVEQKTHDGWNVLMVAARYQPEALKSILDFMGKNLNTNNICKEIVEQTTHDGWNVLMMAVRYQPEVLTDILNFMKERLEPKAMKVILLQKIESGYNALMQAARYQPKALQTILNFLQENREFLDANGCIEILQQQNTDSKNALMLVAGYQSTEMLSKIFSFIVKLSCENNNSNVKKIIENNESYNIWRTLLKHEETNNSNFTEELKNCLREDSDSYSSIIPTLLDYSDKKTYKDLLLKVNTDKLTSISSDKKHAQVLSNYLNNSNHDENNQEVIKGNAKLLYKYKRFISKASHFVSINKQLQSEEVVKSEDSIKKLEIFGNETETVDKEYFQKLIDLQIQKYSKTSFFSMYRSVRVDQLQDLKNLINSHNNMSSAIDTWKKSKVGKNQIEDTTNNQLMNMHFSRFFNEKATKNTNIKNFILTLESDPRSYRNFS